MSGVHKDWVPFRGADDGLAPLDSDGFVPTEHIPGLEGGHVIAGLVVFGNRLNYSLSAGAPADAVQSLLFSLAAGRVYDRMVTFVTAGGSAGRTLQMGIYDQASPLSPGEPLNRVAQTDSVVTTGFSGTYVTLPLTDGAGTPLDYTVPADGFYWQSIITSSNSLKIVTTPDQYPAGYLPRRQYVAVSSILPAVALAGTNPLAACRACAMVEKGIVLPF